jgi:hypothetical protein
MLASLSSKETINDTPACFSEMTVRPGDGGTDDEAAVIEVDMAAGDGEGDVIGHGDEVEWL